MILRVPRGSVATYGQVARLAGYPGCARQVGYALFAAHDTARLPWQRILNAQGRISLPEPEAAQQRQLLLGEGIVFGLRGAVNLKLFGWQP